MKGHSVVAITSYRQTQRQIARTLYSAATEVVFGDSIDRLRQLLQAGRPDLIILDCDQKNASDLVQLLEAAHSGDYVPVILLSVAADKRPLLDLLNHYDIGNLVAKHGAIRAVYPILDERELLVTCEKVMRKDIFGIEKYVGSWAISLHQDTITSRADKQRALDVFSRFLEGLDCPNRIASLIVTVAEELILNAVVHAPVDENGQPKYEHLPLHHEMNLEPREYVDFRYGCDGQRLMLSVSDSFGRLNRETLYEYLRRTFTIEDKPSGAGLGLSLSLAKIHQLVFNVQDSVRTEAIAGWYLRVNSTGEFLRVGKSVNVFYLPKDSKPE